jgi:hypothetical protein
MADAFILSFGALAGLFALAFYSVAFLFLLLACRALWIWIKNNDQSKSRR